jgi:polyhydroxyalkanoate synthesis regulator phasin
VVDGFTVNSCETCYCYGMDHDSNLKACWHCTVSGHHTFESKNFWEPTEWFEAYQQLEARRDELERWYSEHVASTAQLRDDLAAAQKAAKIMNDENQGIVDTINKHLGHLGTHSPRMLVQEVVKQLDAANETIKELKAANDGEQVLDALIVKLKRERDAANERIAELEKARAIPKGSEEY